MMYTQSRKRKWTTHSEDPNSGASSSSILPRGGDFEGGGEQREGNNYEVFLSFRGQDTRKGFTDCLYTSLDDAGIHVFRDDDELPVGEEIGPELFRGIMQSKISIPIISEDYASSKWCLRELALMLKCKRERGQTVLPIFYKVEPGQVRHLAGTFRDAINAHKKNLDERTVQEWEKALEEVTSLKGWESEKTDNGHEGKFIKTVVRKVMSELKRQFLQNVPEQLVGIDDHVERILSFIDAKCSDSRMIGIYGMGGIGKTTLAQVLHNKLSSRYEYRSFVADIRETSKHESIECVQKQLISDINGGLWDVSNVNEGIKILKSRFTSKKVLIILDDVDKYTRLGALVGDVNWFKAGSIVILTTRDKSVLHKAGANHMYPLNELLPDQSLVLFSRHALRMDSPPTNYEVISRDIVSTTGGLPLALEIIGSFLCGKSKEAWKATSEKLKKVPDEDVQKRLRISYDALASENKRMFLDIACFFIGSSKQYPTYMWDACGCYPGKGIEELSLLSLIKIDNNGKLLMHDQLRDMGREIVRLENEKKPEERSRLWNYDDAVEVLGSDKGTSKIEALRLDNWERIYTAEDNWAVAEENWAEQLKELTNYTAEQLKELTNLRFLHVRGANFIGDFQNLLPKLIWLHWDCYSLDFEATNFHLKKLVVLDLSRTKISEDWGGWDPLKMATELKVLNLSHCYSLTATPDFSTFKSLEILIFEGCGRLKEIHPLLGVIKTLVYLNVKGCSQLKELPEWIGSQNKLETLDASYCRRLARIPKSIGSLKKLKTLDVSYCLWLAHIPSSIGHLPSLSLLNLSHCDELAQLPDSIGHLPSLSLLDLSHCHELAQLPDSIGHLPYLSLLDLSHCHELAQLPDSIGHLPSLSLLNLSHCDELAQLPDSIGSLMSLQRLLLSNCHSLREIPDSIGKLTSLTELDLSCSAIVELPDSIRNLQNLSILDISGTLSDTRLWESDAIRIHANIQKSRASGSKNLEGLPGDLVLLNTFSSLQNVSIRCSRELPSCCLARVLSQHPKTPPTNNLARDHQTADSEHLLKRSKPFGISDEVNNLPVNILPVTYKSQSLGQSSHSSNDLPRNVVVTLNQGSPVKSMDFHPVQQILLLVGSDMGDVTVWEVGSHTRIAVRNFKVWDLGTCSKVLQASLANDNKASVNRVMWSPDGILFGVAYSKHIVHIYLYLGGDDIRNHLEIEAHVGSVNDLAFSYPNEQLSVVTCGEDRSIKVWDAVTGAKQHRFEGHEALLYSICPQHKENIQAPPCIRFNKEGILVAVSKSDNSIKILANADGIRLLRTVENQPCDASRVTPGPLVKPSALAAFGSGNATVGASLGDRGAPVAAMVSMNSERMADVKPKFAHESGDKSRIWKLTEINELSQCRSIRLPDNLTAMRVSRLIYTNSGCGILALSSNAVHKLWKWQKSDWNLTGRATTSVVPQLWQPCRGILMTNDISSTNPEDAVPCFALSKNDSYVISASGGMISLFNMMTFERMTTFMPPPPAATFLAFYPQDNSIIAIGMEDSSIQIYNVRVDEAVTFLAFYPQDNDIIAIGMEDSSIQIYNAQFDELETKLRGHRKRITCLAFSNVLNVLVSSGADSQLCVWSTYGWEKLASKTLQMPTGRGAVPFADTHVQFYLDQIDLLVVHETQIAIYEAPKLECLKRVLKWVTREASGPITHATYSCDGQSIYVSFEDGSIGVLTASTLRFRCRINPVAYIPPNPSLRVYPLVIAAHPSEPNQFALGLTDGSVYVLEPSESEGKWGTSPPVENGAGPSTTSGVAASDQPQRQCRPCVPLWNFEH